jgi:hypothetical protein
MMQENTYLKYIVFHASDGVFLKVLFATILAKYTARLELDWIARKKGLYGMRAGLVEDVLCPTVGEKIR